MSPRASISRGHGRNPVPMSGDVTSVDGTTQLLMDETGRVTDAVLEATGAEPRVALLGHSMASGHRRAAGYRG